MLNKGQGYRKKKVLKWHSRVKGEGHIHFLTKYIRGHDQMQFICTLNITQKRIVFLDV